MVWGVSGCKNFRVQILSGIQFCPGIRIFCQISGFLNLFLVWIVMEFYSLFRLVYKIFEHYMHSKQICTGALTRFRSVDKIRN